MAAVGGPTTLSWPAAAVTPPPLDRLVPLPPGGAPGGVAAAPADPVVLSEYRVVAGDSLWAIAARHLGDDDPVRVDRYWRAIYAANRAVVGDDPDLIHPGQLLVLPAEV